MARLFIENGPDKGRSISLSTSEAISLGRDNTATFALRDTMASRIHFQIEFRGGDFWLVDLESMNGTQLNGQPVNEAKLASGDLIHVGDTRISFLTDDTSVGALAGHRMGGYRIIERIGRGGMGIVYKAEQIDLQREVALKVLSEENGTDKEFINLFVHEARASAKLNHPHIVQVYDVKRHGEVYYFSMEFVSGGSLQDLLSKEQKVAPDQAIQMLLDASRGLEYAHSKGFVHRDIKPDNLMVSEEGQIKIADLGLARRVDEKVGPSEEHVVFGTPHYIAPEQVLGRPADFRSDIYSLGSTAYRMLAGTTPYQAPGIRDLVSKKVKEDPRLLHEVDPEIPRELSDIVHQMMARDPERRFETTSEVCSNLEKLQKTMHGEGDPSTSTSGPVPGLVGNRVLLLSTLSLLIIVVVGAVIGASGLFSSEPVLPPPPPDRPNHELALSIMQTAKKYGLFELDRTDESSLTKGINEYQVVIDNFGDSSDSSVVKIVQEARRLKSDLEKDLHELQSRNLLLELDQEALVSWRDLQNRPGEFLIVDKSIQAYADFSMQPEGKGSWASSLASKKEKHLLRWKGEAQKWRTAYQKLLGQITLLEDQQKYREADAKMRAFQDMVIRGKLKCPVEECGVPPERYHSLLLEFEIDRYIEKLRTIAMGEFYQIEKRVKKVLSKEPSSVDEFEGALLILKPVIENSLADIVTLARSLHHKVTNAQGQWTYREAERIRVEENAIRERARVAFVEACEKAHKKVLQYRFRDGLKEIRSRSGGVTKDPYEKLFQEKLQLIGRVVLLIDAISGDFKTGTFRKSFSFPRMKTEGQIHNIKKNSVSVRLPSSGVITFPFTQFTPVEFYTFARSGYKRISARLSCNLAAYCMEFGLYEQAKKELQSVKMMESYRDEEGIRSFVDTYLNMISEGLYTESDEIEAGKRIERVRRFMESKEYPSAQSEVDILKRNYGSTRAFGDSQEFIQSVLDEIGVKSTEQDRKTRFRTRLAHVRDSIQESEKDISFRFQKAVGKIRESKNLRIDPLEQQFQLGDAYSAYGKLSKANEYWKNTRKLIKAYEKEDASEEVWDRLLYLQFGLARNYMLLNETSRAKMSLDEANRHLGKNKSMPYSVQESFGKVFEKWVDGGLGRIREEVRKGDRKLRSSPEDPSLLWNIAETRYRELDNLSGALGYYLFLSQNHPEFGKVRSGEVQAVISEIWYRLKILDKAQEGYRKLEDHYPDHWRNKKDKGKSYTQKRIISCQNLATKFDWDLP